MSAADMRGPCTGQCWAFSSASSASWSDFSRAAADSAISKAAAASAVAMASGPPA